MELEKQLMALLLSRSNSKNIRMIAEKIEMKTSKSLDKDIENLKGI